MNFCSLLIAGATKNNALTFKDEYNNASGSVIDRISKGLGAVSETYGRDLDQSTGKIGQEWDRITGNLKTSSKDFFGAEPATNRLTDKLKEVEDSGRKFREEITKGANESGAIKKNLKDGADALIDAGDKLSQKLRQALLQFQKEEAVDPGGKLKKEFEKHKLAGRNAAAEATIEKIENLEKEKELRGFGDKRDRRRVRDIAEDEGVDTFGKGDLQMRQDILDKRKAEAEAVQQKELEATQQHLEEQKEQEVHDAEKRQEELKPGKQGEKDKEPAKQESALSGVLGEIKGLVDSINGKLPLHALGY